MSENAPIPPSLPLYQKPKERQPAVIPAGIEEKKMPGIMNKMISRVMPKMRFPKGRGIKTGQSVKMSGKATKASKSGKGKNQFE